MVSKIMVSEEAKKYLKNLMSGKSISSTMNPCDEVMKAFDAGVESEKKKYEWHDLRKNPNDLPKRSGLYCVQCGEVREFDKEEKSWFTVNFCPCMNRTEETYLWCELPKFEE